MTTTTRNWKFFLERDDVWDVRLFGGGRFDGFGRPLVVGH
jgi:hypothetical protein